LFSDSFGRGKNTHPLTKNLGDPEIQNAEAGARVVALEPAPPNFRYLLWNLRVRQTTTLGDPKLLFQEKLGRGG